MSKSDYLELAVANAVAKPTGHTFPVFSAWQVQPIIGATDPTATQLEGGSGYTVPSYSGYAALAVAESEFTVAATGTPATTTFVINVRKTFNAVAGSNIQLRRFVLQGSTDGGSTWHDLYYSDTDLNTTVNVGVQPYLEANTGFTGSEA